MASTLADSLEIRSDQVFANINMDMLGRHDQVHGPDEPYLYVVHHHENQSIRPFTEQVNTLCGDLQLDFSYSRADDPERLFMRSDHYAFHQLGIPAFFLFSGLHEDYHKPTDTADKISVARLARNAGFVLNLAWQLAQRPERLDPVEP
jgi:Zn-dependent M28 family amino/carboxypeptidase